MYFKPYCLIFILCQNLNFIQKSSIRPSTLDRPWSYYLFLMFCTAVKTEAEIIVVKQMLPGEKLASGIFYFPAVFLFFLFSFWTFFTFLLLGNHWKWCFQYIIKCFTLFLFFRIHGWLSQELKSFSEVSGRGILWPNALGTTLMHHERVKAKH